MFVCLSSVGIRKAAGSPGQRDNPRTGHLARVPAGSKVRRDPPVLCLPKGSARPTPSRSEVDQRWTLALVTQVQTQDGLTTAYITPRE